jgi:polyphosphate glucokinase
VWIGTSLTDLFGEVLPDATAFLNDADAQAVAESAYGAGRGRDGLVITVTFGTGIGTGLINHGRLIPNAELGHLELDGVEAESTTSARAREDAELSWEAWGAMASRYLQYVENLLWPDLFVIGGGLAKRPENWLPHVRTRTPLRPAALINNAGIVGAAHAAARPHE